MRFDSLTEPAEAEKRWVLDWLSNQSQQSMVVKAMILEYHNQNIKLPDWIKAYPENTQKEFKIQKNKNYLLKGSGRISRKEN